MTTPKELADRAKKLSIETDFAEDAKVSAAFRVQLNATIDQLQAMAEARQGGGEPVAWVDKEGERAITAKTKAKMLADGGACASSVLPYNIPAYTHPPSAQQATGKFFDRLQETKATPAGREMLRQAMQEDEDCAKATGFGQVLTEEVERLTSALRNMRSNAAPRALSWTWADCKVASEAADMLDRLAAPTTGKREPEVRDE